MVALPAPGVSLERVSLLRAGGSLATRSAARIHLPLSSKQAHVSANAQQQPLAALSLPPRLAALRVRNGPCALASDASDAPRFALPVKWVVLVLLVAQNAATTMLVQRSRRPPPSGELLYLGGAAVLLSECFKLPTCLFLICKEEGGLRAGWNKVRDSIFGRLGDTLRMGVPALCYGLQNLLFFVALSNLTATSYQLWSQTKTLFTALFFVRILGQTIRPMQWLALALLTGGVGVVQLEEASAIATATMRGTSATGSTSAAAAAAAAAASASAASSARSVTIGVAAVLLSSVLSGFANIYFEKVIKQAECEYDDSCDVPEEAGGLPNAPASLWIRNVQLALFSLPQAALLILANQKSRRVIASHGLLAGFTPLVWLVTLLTAGGGLLVAAVVKYADNVLKTYATALAILVTCTVGTLTTGVAPSPGFLSGMAMVLMSMLLYNGSGTLNLSPVPVGSFFHRPWGWWRRRRAGASLDSSPADCDDRDS